WGFSFSLRSPQAWLDRTNTRSCIFDRPRIISTGLTTSGSRFSVTGIDAAKLTLAINNRASFQLGSADCFWARWAWNTLVIVDDTVKQDEYIRILSVSWYMSAQC
ncbi:hypothetical protein A0J61_07083, partial [Choanephora cucurbitarum]